MSLLSEKKVTILDSQEIVAANVFLGAVPQVPQAMNVATAVYSFANSGGAVGTYTLVLSKPIPANSSIVRLFVQEPLAIVGAGATYSLGATPSNTNLLPALTAFNLTTTSIPNLQVVADVVSLNFVVAGAPLTAGVIEFNLVYA